MTVRFYSSADAGAPALRGNTAGDLINLLDKCLVTGYGSKSPAGWSKPFTGTNVAAFKTGAGSNGMYLRISEPVGSGSYPAARVKGYETMTDVNTGTGDFPTEGQMVGGLYWYKQYSGAAVADPRTWFLLADESFMVLVLQTYPSSMVNNPGYYCETYMFGDLANRGPNDVYSTIIVGQESTSGNSSQNFPLQSNSISSPQTGLYMPRPYNGLGGSIKCCWSGDSRKSGTDTWGGSDSYLQYPHGPDGALLMSPVWVAQPGSTNQANLRGTLKGVWCPLQRYLGQMDTFDGQGEMAGKKFFNWRHYSAAVFLEISDTWGT